MHDETEDADRRIEASVVLCTFNPRKAYLDRVVASLRAQTLPVEKWEFIIIDNASDQPVADQCDLSWHPAGRHVREQRLGLVYARQRGVAESRAPLLVFVDDDNVLAPDYLERAVEIATTCGHLDVWGSGSISPEFEVQPAEHIKPLIPFLAIRHAERPVWCNSATFTDATPVGAGMCVRRHVGEAYVELTRHSAIEIGAKGASLDAHDDYEICFVACNGARGVGIFPELKITHLIPRNRLTDSYMTRLVEGRTYSHFVLLYKWTGALPRTPFSLHGAASLCLNLLRRRGFDRHVYFAEMRALVAARRRFRNGTQSNEIREPKPSDVKLKSIWSK
jgi:glycosyltransferase involved in cell wall biosynthesis